MYYQINRETSKLELIFDKAEYMALEEKQKSEIKSNFLFSKRIGGWVSRAKWPNTRWAEDVAKKLGAEDRGKTGEALTFAEQMERKAERAEERAERMEQRAAAAEKRGEALQKPINDMHGDVAFFTQPNINSSAGRAFTNKRNRMFAAFDRGFEEFKKSEYYREKAETARETAAWTKPKDKAFCIRRIKDAEKAIRAQQKNLEYYRRRMEEIENGEQPTRYDGSEITREDVERWIENAEEIMDNEISKSVYYSECLDDLGGVEYSRENVKPGWTVKLKRYGVATVKNCGPQNITFVLNDGPNAGWEWKAPYADIVEIVSTEVKTEIHPFKVGDAFDLDTAYWKGCPTVRYTVEKVTDKTVTLKNETTGATVRRTPDKWAGRCYKNGFAWEISNLPGAVGWITVQT